MRARTTDPKKDLRDDLLIWHWDTAIGVPPSIISIFILIDIISKVDYVVNRILSHRISIGVEEPKCYELLIRSVQIQ